METMKYPEQWGQASDVWSQLASGQYTNPGMDWLRNMMQSGGAPVDVSGWGAAQQPLMMQQFSDMTKQMAEQAGMGGTRYGSGLQGNIARYGGQLQNQFQSNLMDRWLQSQEAAKGRAYGAGQGLSQLGLQGQVAGAEGLGGLGQQYANLPMQLAQSMTGVGGYMTGQQIDPWTQMMAGMVGNPYMTQQTYQQSPTQSILGILGGMPWGDIFGGGGGGGGTPGPELPSWMQPGTSYGGF